MVPIKTQTIFNYFIKKYGIGKTTSLNLCSLLKISPKSNLSEMDNNDNLKIEELMNKYYTQESFIKKRELNKFLHDKQILHVKYFKFKAGLPINGQRTKTNGKTAKKLSIQKINQLKKLDKNYLGKDQIEQENINVTRSQKKRKN